MDQLPRIFIAYSHEDKPLLQKLRTHLNVMKRQQHCEIFFDGEIMPGETWDKRLKDELHAAHIFVLLVTAEFLDSDYVNETELPKILERRSKGEAEVVAVIMKDCLWEMTALQHLQVVLHNGDPIEERGAYAHAAREVFRVIEHRNKNLKEEPEAASEVIEARPPTAEELKQRKVAEAQRQERRQQRLAVKPVHRRRRPLDPFLDLMIPIKGGSFKMGDEHGDLGKECLPLHDVTVKDFHLCKHPVTQAQWRGVMGSDPPKLNFKGCDDCPVERVSWDDGQEFIKKLNQLTGKKYRLPSEAEWEYAARGGNQSKKYKFAGSDDVDEVAWHGSNSGSKTHPVVQKEANELGLYDLSGNVWEWCLDNWHDSYEGAPKDGSAWIAGGSEDIRVVRGGSWVGGTEVCRSANRNRINADYRYPDIGFRLAR